MAKVLTFSQVFPADHYRAGAKTGFPAKILSALMVDPSRPEYFDFLCGLNRDNLDARKYTKRDLLLWLECVSRQNPGPDKIHTIRGAGRFVPGELASPRVWFDEPYNSPQIILWQPLEIKQALPFEVRDQKVFINGLFYCESHDVQKIYPLAMNDGLSVSDFLSWFKFPAPVTEKSIYSWSKVDYFNL
jgi:hypothetical protein